RPDSGEDRVRRAHRQLLHGPREQIDRQRPESDAQQGRTEAGEVLGGLDGLCPDDLHHTGQAEDQPAHRAYSTASSRTRAWAASSEASCASRRWARFGSCTALASSAWTKAVSVTAKCPAKKSRRYRS